MQKDKQHVRKLADGFAGLIPWCLPFAATARISKMITDGSLIVSETRESSALFTNETTLVDLDGARRQRKEMQATQTQSTGGPVTALALGLRYRRAFLCSGALMP